MLFIPFIAGSGEFPEESINCIIPSLSCGVYQGRMKCQTLWLLIYPLQILFLVLYSWSNGIYIIIGRNHFGKMVAWSHRGRWAADSPEASPPGPPAVVPGQCRLAR